MVPEFWNDPRHEELRRLVGELDREAFPRNVSVLLKRVLHIWHQTPLAPYKVSKPAKLRGRLKALKTNQAICKWLFEGAPLPQMAAARTSLLKLQYRLFDLPADHPDFGRLKMRLQVHPLCNAILAGLEIWEAEHPNAPFGD